MRCKYDFPPAVPHHSPRGHHGVRSRIDGLMVTSHIDGLMVSIDEPVVSIDVLLR